VITIMTEFHQSYLVGFDWNVETSHGIKINRGWEGVTIVKVFCFERMGISSVFITLHST
jgi:hypothetical protein